MDCEVEKDKAFCNNKTDTSNKRACMWTTGDEDGEGSSTGNTVCFGITAKSSCEQILIPCLCACGWGATALRRPRRRPRWSMLAAGPCSSTSEVQSSAGVAQRSGSCVGNSVYWDTAWPRGHARSRVHGSSLACVRVRACVLRHRRVKEDGRQKGMRVGLARHGRHHAGRLRYRALLQHTDDRAPRLWLPVLKTVDKTRVAPRAMCSARGPACRGGVGSHTLRTRVAQPQLYAHVAQPDSCTDTPVPSAAATEQSMPRGTCTSYHAHVRCVHPTCTAADQYDSCSEQKAESGCKAADACKWDAGENSCTGEAASGPSALYPDGSAGSKLAACDTQGNKETCNAFGKKTSSGNDMSYLSEHGEGASGGSDNSLCTWAEYETKTCAGLDTCYADTKDEAVCTKKQGCHWVVFKGVGECNAVSPVSTPGCSSLDKDKCKDDEKCMWKTEDRKRCMWYRTCVFFSKDTCNGAKGQTCFWDYGWCECGLLFAAHASPPMPVLA